MTPLEYSEGEKAIVEFLSDPKDMERLDKGLLDQDLSEKLQQALGGLDDRDGKIITWRYGLDGKGSLTLDEIGKRLKISKERVRQIEERACDKLRAKLEELRDIAA